MGYLTTHVLDTAQGRPAREVSVALYRIDDAQCAVIQRHLVAETVTNDDGRCERPLLEGEGFSKGLYELVFDVGSYYRNQGTALPDPAFLEEVVLRFGVADPGAHYHVPLLLSPYGYSTYRGS